MTRALRLTIASLFVVACVGCSVGGHIGSAGGRVGFLEGHPRKAKVVRYEEEHLCADDCSTHQHERVDVDIDD